MYSRFSEILFLQTIAIESTLLYPIPHEFTPFTFMFPLTEP